MEDHVHRIAEMGPWVMISARWYYLFQTPQNHRVHHALDLDLGSSNLANWTTIPDLLFGTFRHPDKHHHGDLGITGEPLPANVFKQFLWPLVPASFARSRSGGAMGEVVESHTQPRKIQ